MQTIDLIQQIQRLPLNQRFYIVEETIKSIKKEELNQQMEMAANELYIEYVSDKELTAEFNYQVRKNHLKLIFF